MSVPFSKTHLCVPRGFGAILEGLTREVLRDQPEDIPQFAARYFNGLLQRRETEAESGIDPAEWAAKLEDRFCNNYVFKSSETCPDKEAETEEAISIEKFHKSKTEEESGKSTDSNVGENSNTDNFGVKQDISAESSEEESTNMLLDTYADGQKGTKQEKDQMAQILDEVDIYETESSFVSDQKMSLPEVEPKRSLSPKEITNIDLGAAEDDVDNKPVESVLEKNTADGEEHIEVAEAIEIPLYTAIAELCAGSLNETEEETLAKVDSNRNDIEEVLKPVPEDTALQSSLTQIEITTSNEQEAAFQDEITKEEELMVTGESSSKTFESVDPVVGGTGVTQKENSLVEINFEDLPEIQPVTVVEAEQSKDTEVLQDLLLEMPPKETYDLIEAATIQNQSGTHVEHESEIVIVEKDVGLKEGIAEKPQEAFALADEQENTGEFMDEAGNKTHSDKPKQEEDTINDNERFVQNEEITSTDCELKDNEVTITAEGDKEDQLEGYSNIKDQEINHATLSSAAATAMEAERSSFNKSAKDSFKEEEVDKESLRALAESQSEDTVNPKWVTLEEQLRDELTQVEVAKEKDDAVHVEDNLTLICRSPADQNGKESPNKSEKDTIIPPEQGADTEECSRPQEEEDIMDIPLDDPEANRAAAKIQAGFRGHMTRKKMKPEDKAEGEERQEDRGQ